MGDGFVVSVASGCAPEDEAFAFAVEAFEPWQFYLLGFLRSFLLVNRRSCEALIDRLAPTVVRQELLAQIWL